MRQRHRIGGNAISVAIPGRVEMLVWTPPFLIAMAEVMQQRIYIGCTHVRMLLEIPRGIEIKIWPAAFAPAVATEVQ